jgi:hypothetical protein
MHSIATQLGRDVDRLVAKPHDAAHAAADPHGQLPVTLDPQTQAVLLESAQRSPTSHPLLLRLH